MFAFNGISNIKVSNGAIFRIGHVAPVFYDPKLEALLKNSRKGKSLPNIPDEDPIDPELLVHAMTVFVDGVRVAPGYISDIPPSTVGGVEILTSNAKTAIYGNDGYWGVILITTKRGDEEVLDLPRFNIEHFKTNGYSSSKEFYSPAYDAPDSKATMADMRSTIYWNPDIVTDAAGKANLSFYNSDGTGTYKVTLEGMDTKGGLLRKTITYKVN